MKLIQTVVICLWAGPALAVGPILLMHLNESEGTTVFMDSSGNNDDGTCTNCPTRGAFGVFNPAMTFDGANDEITGMNVGAAGTSDWTISAWVRTTDTSAGVILTNRAAAGERSMTLHSGFFANAGTANGNAYYTNDGPGCEYGAQGTSNIADGDFHHLVGVRSGVSNYFIYVDGTQEGTNNVIAGAGCESSSASTTSNWVLANGPAWTGAFWVGQLAEVSIYDSALTRSQIRGMYMRGVNQYIEAAQEWANVFPYSATYFQRNLGL